MVKLSRKDDVVEREVVGEVFLVPISGHLADLQELFVLNETGRYLWERLDDSCSLDDLARDLVEEFEVDEETALRDVETFAKQLVEARLAQPRDTGEVT